MHMAAGILAERENISPSQALDLMRARAAADTITMAVLGRRFVQHRGWPPAHCHDGERLAARHTAARQEAPARTRD